MKDIFRSPELRATVAATLLIGLGTAACSSPDKPGNADQPSNKVTKASDKIRFFRNDPSTQFLNAEGKPINQPAIEVGVGRGAAIWDLSCDDTHTLSFSSDTLQSRIINHNAQNVCVDNVITAADVAAIKQDYLLTK